MDFKRKQLIELFVWSACVVIPLGLLYLAVAANVWAWRNPKANQMTVWREFGSVVTFKKLEKYQ